MNIYEREHSRYVIAIGFEIGRSHWRWIEYLFLSFGIGVLTLRRGNHTWDRWALISGGKQGETEA